MEIKRRDMRLTNFYDDKCNKLYFSKVKKIGNMKTVVSILKWLDVKNNLEVHYNFKDETIIASNYTWIQIAPFDNNFWIKAMYDEKDNLVEIYIDVTRHNYFDDITNPSYEDLFLDIVIPKKGHIYQMDDVELMKAYHENLISEKEYKMAKVVCKKLIAFLNKNHQEFLNYMCQLREELNYELENN